MPWQVVETGETDGASVTVRVTDNAETRESYPFAFSVTIRYVLRGGELRFEQTYENTGSTDMRSPSVSIPISVFPMCATWSGISKPA